MKKLKTILSIMLIINIFSACVQVKSGITNDEMRKLKNYAWVEMPSHIAKFSRYSPKKNLELDIREEVSKELNLRGLKLNKKNPDVVISYKAIFEKDELIHEKVDGATAGAIGGSINLNNVPIESNLLSIKIDFIDPVHNRILWSVYKTRQLSEVSSLSSVIEKEVKILFVKYPVKKNKS